MIQNCQSYGCAQGHKTSNEFLYFMDEPSDPCLSAVCVGFLNCIPELCAALDYFFIFNLQHKSAKCPLTSRLFHLKSITIFFFWGVGGRV